MTSPEFTILLKAFHSASEDQRNRQLDRFAQSMGEQKFCQLAANHLVELSRPEKAIPESLVSFAPMVRDGIIFFLSKLSYHRLRRAILSQARLQLDCQIGERLVDLALHFPTLHKIGQIVARNPGLDPNLKGWLIHLEQGDYSTDLSDLMEKLDSWLEEANLSDTITLWPDILAEASVAAVLPFTRQTSNHPDQIEGVFKALKPDIDVQLLEELLILDSLTGYFESNRERYGLQDMKVSNLFREVREDLRREIDLVAEQKNIAEAAEIYKNVHGVMIPGLFPFCTPTVTSMEFVDGIRVTDTGLSVNQRQALARLIFEAVICTPLFLTEESALFHGDPHAGNILATRGKFPDDYDIALIDWTLAGYLKRTQRSHMMEMMVGIMTEDVGKICEAIRLMIKETVSTPESIEKCVTRFIKKMDHREDPLKIVFRLMAQLTMEGFVFPSELMLFRKAFFTLEGVLDDISPGFSMAETMENYLGRLLLEEIPLRIVTAVLPISDNSLDYRTLLTNKNVQNLAFYQVMSVWNQAMTTGFSFIGIQTKMITDYFYCLSGSHLFKNQG